MDADATLTEKVLARPSRVCPHGFASRKSAFGALTELGASAWVAESYKGARAFVGSRVNPQFGSAQGNFTERVGHSVMARSSDGQKERLEWQSTMKRC